MPRTPDQRKEKARELFLQGLKLIEISEQLGIPEGTIRSWKNRYKWDCNVANKKRNVAKHRGGQKGNKNAVDHGAPKENKNAEKYGFFSKYLPDETREIFSAIDQADPLDLLWHQIQIAYAAIIRAQRIAYVRDQEDRTKEKIGSFDNGDTYIVQQAWDKQNEFLKAQARAQGELRALIKQYDEMLHKDWESASEEQRCRIEHIRAQTERISTVNQSGDEDGVVIINDLQKRSETIGDSNSEISGSI